MAKQQQLTKFDPTKASIKELVKNDAFSTRLTEVIGDKAKKDRFVTTLLQIASDPKMKNCSALSIFNSAVTAATMSLSISPQLGHAYIVPYNEKSGTVAQFQIGWKGFVQLALRSGQVKALNAAKVYKNQNPKFNSLLGEFSFDCDKEPEGPVAGYACYLELNSGFKKTLYMSVDEVSKHAQKFSKSYKSDSSIWKKDFDAMALKTIVKKMVTTYCPLVAEMEIAIKADQSVQVESGNYSYPDSPQSEFDDTNYQEFTEVEPDPAKPTDETTNNDSNMIQ